MIIYRSHKGSLEESLSFTKEFKTISEMKAYICKTYSKMYKNMGYPQPFSEDDIVIQSEEIHDDRCGWYDTRYVCLKRLGKEDYIKMYGSAQCIGMCATNYKRLNRL